MVLAQTKVVLASSSKARQALLQRAGVEFEALTPGVDEASVKDSLERDAATAAEVAQTLADLKAVSKAAIRPGALVIGADQVLALEKQVLSKPSNLVAAKEQLSILSGKTHALHTAVAVALDGTIVWRYITEAALTMRPFTESFIEHYLMQTGELALESVGAYQIERAGIQLFTNIQGDYFAIIGLPILPLLEFLREHQILER